MCRVQNNITWAQKRVEYYKIILWFPSNIIYIDYMFFGGKLYDVHTIFYKHNWFDTFYNLLWKLIFQILPIVWMTSLLVPIKDGTLDLGSKNCFPWNIFEVPRVTVQCHAYEAYAPPQRSFNLT